MKTCRVCGETKVFDDFYPRSNAADGYRNDCKACNTAARVARQFANHEAYLTYQRQNREVRKDFYNSQRVAKRTVDGSVERERDRARYVGERREQSKQRVREWLIAHPEARRRLNARRRATLLGAFVEDVAALVVLEIDDGVCGICGNDVDPMDFHVDHVVPLSRGGEHSYANTQIAHPFCNLTKGASI